MEPHKAESVARHLTVTFESSVFMSGPLPIASQFAGYEEVCPGAARDLLNMASASQKHAHHIEKVEVYGALLLKVLGLCVAVGLVAGMLSAALYAAASGHSALAVTIASGTGAALVAGVFLRNYANRPEPPAPEDRQPDRAPPRKGRRR